MHTLGIDIGKSTMHVCLLTESGKTFNRRLDTTSKGNTSLVEWIAQKVGERVHACMEATGGWEAAVARYLHAQQHTVSIVNPYRIKSYGQSEGSRSKTDRADAALIARFCRTQCPSAWKPPTEAEQLLTEQVRRCAELKQMRAAERNRLAAPLMVSAVRRLIERHIAMLDEQIAELTESIRAHIASHEELRRRRDLITSIPGIADTTAEVILGELGDLLRFKNARQLAAFCGVVPCEWSSGTSVHRRALISKQGNARLRAALYYPAMTAIQHNPLIRTFAERLRNAGKTGKQIIVAAMRKLLHLIYGVVKNNAPFDPNWRLDK
jgi:transposase